MKTFKQLRECLDNRPQFDDKDALAAANALGLHFVELKELKKKKDRNPNEIDINEFVMGLNVELEHSSSTYGDLLATAKIALDHLREMPNYYSELKKMEKKND